MKKILFAGAEAMPFAATGGLGDVMGSLPIALKAARPDWDIRAVLPLYSEISDEYRAEMKFECWTTVAVSWRQQYCGIFSLERGGVKYYFIDNEYYFKRDALYGFFDDGERFAFFSNAILALMGMVDFFPDVYSANDWQTALSVILLKRRNGMSPGYSGVKAVYTIHNIEYQGVYGRETMGDLFGLDEMDASTVEFDGAVNLTKGAILCADAVTTVSPKYAEEIQTPFFAHGLHDILREHSFKLSGIVNGIDTDFYNPKTDKDLKFNYSYRGLTGKGKNKAALQEEYGLPVCPDVPVIAMVSRLVDHKGFDLVREVAYELLSRDMQFVLLGTGDYDTECFFREYAARSGGKAGVKIEYNRKLSKLVYAGADMFLMPSRSEPCGLAQMIASRYGTVPIVREAGGLYDTIKPYYEGDGNGFTFAAYNARDMLSVIDQAIALYHDKEKWTALVKKVMKTDFSWNVSAEKYAELFLSLSPEN